MNILERALAWLEGPQTAPSGIDRRKFLAILGGTAVGAAVAPLIDVEKLLWTPKPIVLVDGAEAYLTIDWITREALAILENNLSLTKVVNRTYDQQFTREHPGHLIGMTVPTRFNHLPVVLTDQRGVELEMDPAGWDKPVDRHAFRERVLRPAVNAITDKLPQQVVFGELPLCASNRDNYMDVDNSRSSNVNGGPSIRAIKGTTYDPVNDQMLNLLRLDVLTGEA